MKKALLILAGAFMMMLPATAPAAMRRGVIVGRPFYAAPYYGGYWGSYWGGPYWGNSYWGTPEFAYTNEGEVKIDTKVKDAQVFINGALAGSTHDNKTMHLRPGDYNIQIREAGRTVLDERVYVVRGKTVHLHPEL